MIEIELQVGGVEAQKVHPFWIVVLQPTAADDSNIDDSRQYIIQLPFEIHLVENHLCKKTRHVSLGLSQEPCSAVEFSKDFFLIANMSILISYFLVQMLIGSNLRGVDPHMEIMLY